MKVKVNSATCDGFGTCAGHAPEVFELDDWGYASATGDGVVQPEHESEVRRAIADCPVRAIVEVTA